jgi:hypothetical protein
MNLPLPDTYTDERPVNSRKWTLEGRYEMIRHRVSAVLLVVIMMLVSAAVADGAAAEADFPLAQRSRSKEGTGL